jgi:transmembrane sensor
LDHADGTDSRCEVDRKHSELPQSKNRKGWGLAAAVVLAAAVAFWLVAPITRGAETYLTAVGEQRSVKLKDGSVIYLNTDSLVKIHYTAAARDVQLLKGEALFTVEHDTMRPFRVSAGTAVVRALGTEFDVYLQPARTLIAVVDGEVNVLLQRQEGSALPAQSNPHAPTPTALASARLAAGERASIDLDGQIRKDAQRNVQVARDWQRRRLVFDEATLAEVAAEFNRYNRAQIVVEGADLRTRLISGIFSADHPQTLFLYLQRRDESLVVDTKSDEFVIRFRPRDTL